MKKPPVAWGRQGWLILPVLLASLAHGADEMPAEWVARQEAALGRLFFTPEQRLALDRLRFGASSAGSGSDERDVTPEESLKKPVEEALPPKVITGPRYVSLSGIVLKGNNQAVVWLNGQPVENDGPFEGEGFRALPNQLDERGVPIIPEGSTHIFHLKSGQTLDLVAEQIKNTYEINPRVLKARREPPPTEEKTGDKASDQQAKEFDQQAKESDKEAKKSDKQAKESDKEAKKSDKQAKESDKEAKKSDKQAEDEGAELAKKLKKSADVAKGLKKSQAQELGSGGVP